MKRLLSISLALMMIGGLLFSVSASAADENRFIFDEREVLSQDELSEAQALSKSIYDDSSVAVCYISVEQLEDVSSSEYAKEFFQKTSATDGIVLIDYCIDYLYRQSVYTYGSADLEGYKDYLRAAYNNSASTAEGVIAYYQAAQSITDGTAPEGAKLQPLEEGEDGQLIVDTAHLLTDEEISALTEKAKNISDAHSCSVVIVTSPRLDGKTSTAFADDYYDYHGYLSDGVLLLIALDNGMGSRAWAISTTGECIKGFNESEQEDVIDDIKPSLQSKQWYSAFDKYLTGVDNAITPHVAWYWIPLSLLIAFVVSFLIMLIFRSQLKSVKMQSGARDYLRAGSMKVTVSRDTFLYHTVTRTAKPKDTGSSSGGGTHIGSSGSSHGGSSGTF